MTQDNYNNQEQRHLSYGAARSCILEIRQMVRADGSLPMAELADLALMHMERCRPPRPAREDANVLLFPRHRINEVNALLTHSRENDDG